VAVSMSVYAFVCMCALEFTLFRDFSRILGMFT